MKMETTKRGAPSIRKGSRSYMEKMLEGHVTGENLTLDFTNNLVYSDSDTIKWG
jgi:hypothetical protein